MQSALSPPQRLPGHGIPRLQELSFLEVATLRAEAGATFNEIRRSLIDHMAGLREAETVTGNSALFRLGRHDEHRYLNNAVETLAELMRIGVLERQPLPSTKNAADAYQVTRFTLTPEGRDWAKQLVTARAAAYDWLLGALWRAHPQFAAYLRLLGKSPLIIPTARWTEAHPGNAGAVGEEGRPAYIRFLAARAAAAISRSDTGWQATELEIADAMRTYLGERIDAAKKRNRPNPYPRNRDFVGACEEALVSYAFSRAGFNLDYISHEILRRWTKALAVANFSYHVPGNPALRLWSTADIDERRGTGAPSVRRHTSATWADRVIDALPEAYARARQQEVGNSWVPVYRVRAAVCFALKINDGVFDAAIRQFLTDKRRREAPFRLNFDSTEYGSTPPTEQPLKVADSSGRIRTYRVVSLVPVVERSLP